MALDRPPRRSIEVPGVLTETGLCLPEQLSFEDWLETGGWLARVEHTYRWCIGDWLNYGDRAYGEKYHDGLHMFDLDYGSLRDCAWVAANIELSRRRDKLSWSHHREIADLLPDEQDAWLDRAEAGHWSRQELRKRIRGLKALAEADLLPKTPLLRFCQADMPTATIVSLILRVAFPDAETALDTTYGDGGFWDGSAHVEVTGLDHRPDRAPELRADFTDLDYADNEFDVVLFDPRHLADSSAGAIMANRYSTVSDDQLPFVIDIGTREAWRVARLGIVIKVTDHVHGQEFVSESDWVRGALDGQRPYEVVHQVRSGALIDPKWEEQLSAYNNGATYLIFRKDSPRHIRRRNG